MEKLTSSSLNPNAEFEKLKHNLKEQIQGLVEEGHIKQGKKLIAEYEEIVVDDFDLYSIKGIINLIEGDYIEAEKYFLSGLEIRNFDIDLNYNLAYLYEQRNEYIKTFRQYKKLMKIIPHNQKEELIVKIQEMESKQEVIEYNKRKKVLIISYIFPPVGGSGVQRTLKFVKYLRNFGWEPVIVTVGKNSYPLKDETLEIEIPNEIQIVRIDEKKELDLKYINALIDLYQRIVVDSSIMNEYVNELNKSQDNLRNLILQPDQNVTFVKETLDTISEIVDLEDIDLFYSTSGPYSNHLIGYFLKQRFSKPWVTDFRDEWTNNAYVEYDKSSVLYHMHYSMEQNILQYSDKVLTTTPLATKNYVQTFNNIEEKVSTLTNGYDESDFRDIEIYSNESDKFKIMHNGIFYMIRTPETFLVAVKNLISKGFIDKQRIQINFTWTENEIYWKEYVEKMDLSSVVSFLGYLDHHESLSLAAGADLLLLIVGPGEKNKSVYPGKLFEYLRLGKSILSLSPKGSLVEDLIEEFEIGENFEFNDISSIEKFILKCYSNWESGGRNSFDAEGITKYERSYLTKKLSGVFKETCSSFVASENYDDTEKNSKFYNNLFESGGWNETYFKHYSEIHYIDIWEKAIEIVKSIPNPNIIDIGCGPGQFANLLFDHDLTNYKGIDFSSKAIEFAKIRNDKFRKLFNVDDVYTTGIFNEDYNTAVIFEVLEHLNQDISILQRIRAKTNVLFSVPNFYSNGHVRWFQSKIEVFERYKDYIDISDIFTFDVGGQNKIYLVKGIRNLYKVI